MDKFVQMLVINRILRFEVDRTGQRISSDYGAMRASSIIRTHTSIKAEPTAKARSMTIVIENTGASDMLFILPPTIIRAAMNPVHTAMNTFPNWRDQDIMCEFAPLCRI